MCVAHVGLRAIVLLIGLTSLILIRLCMAREAQLLDRGRCYCVRLNVPKIGVGTDRPCMGVVGSLLCVLV